MTRNTREALRLMFVVRPHEVELLETLIPIWKSAFANWPKAQVPAICVWVTGQHLHEEPMDGVCVHYLELDDTVDFYARSPLKKTPWSPWGLKSGPNFQFFEILRRMHGLQETEWVLQLETDTVPLRKVDRVDIGWILDSDDVWVAGSSAAYAEAKSLSRSTASHLNGAAFYRVGDSEVINFLLMTWARSLLHIVSSRPALAYDSLTSPGVWSELPGDLRASWLENKGRFQNAAGMVNLSNRTLSTRDPHSQLEEAGHVCAPGDSPWFLHLAKSKY